MDAEDEKYYLDLKWRHYLDLLCECVNELDEWYDDSHGTAPMTNNAKVNEARQLLVTLGYKVSYPLNRERIYSDLVLEELKNPTKLSSIVSTLDISNRKLTKEEERQFFERVYNERV